MSLPDHSMPDPAGMSRLAAFPLDKLIACHDCDLLLSPPALSSGEKAVCPQCGHELHVQRHNVVMRSLALVIAALALYIPANFLPIMHLNLWGQSSNETLWSGVLGLYNSGMQGVALVVFLCSMAIPLVKLLCQLVVLLSIRLNCGRSLGVRLYRYYHHLRDWGMLEVYLMGVLVAIVKLADMAQLSLGIGLACFVGLLLTQVWLEVCMSPQQIWGALSRQGAYAGD